MDTLHTHKSLAVKILICILILMIVGCIWGAYSYAVMSKQNIALQNENKDLTEALKNSNDSLASAQQEKTNLTNALIAQGQKNQTFADQLDSINKTVDTYQRLSQTDPELLQKYSKVYFLNENYIPSALTLIDTKYLSNKKNPLQFHDRAWPFLKNLLDGAASDGVTIQMVSAYRSFGTQAALKSSYKVTYGAGTANSFSADQGYSEHQLGTAIDFTTPALGGGLTGFEKTSAYSWLNANAYKYGFILSYPPNNAYYIYEPWHWRFVGLDLALRLHTEGKNFYDLDQRDISSYLANFFNGTTTSATSTSAI